MHSRPVQTERQAGRQRPAGTAIRLLLLYATLLCASASSLEAHSLEAGDCVDEGGGHDLVLQHQEGRYNKQLKGQLGETSKNSSSGSGIRQRRLGGIVAAALGLGGILRGLTFFCPISTAVSTRKSSLDR